MALKLVVLCYYLAFTYGSIIPEGIISGPARTYGVPVAIKTEDFETPLYKFAYDVADTLTGDYKSQVEQRDGDLVKGHYSLVESDGTLRVVEYTADPIRGFNAIVRNEPLPEAPIVAEPTIIPARYTAAPFRPQTVVAAKSGLRRFAGAPVGVSPQVIQRFEVAPSFARYGSPSLIANQYGPPVASSYNYGYPAPVNAPFRAPVQARYFSPANSLFNGPFTAPYATAVSAPFTGQPTWTAAYPGSAYAARYAAYTSPVGTSYTELLASALPAPVVVAPAAVEAVPAAPAKLVEAVAVTECD